MLTGMKEKQYCLFFLSMYVARGLLIVFFFRLRKSMLVQMGSLYRFSKELVWLLEQELVVDS